MLLGIPKLLHKLTYDFMFASIFLSVKGCTNLTFKKSVLYFAHTVNVFS